MPGEPYEAGGTLIGLAGLIRETRDAVRDGVASVIEFGRAIERKGSSLPPFEGLFVMMSR